MSNDAELTLLETPFPHVTQQPWDEVAYAKPTPGQLAYQDIASGLSKWRIWLMLAYQDIKLRYRRSILGPFWLTLSMAITVYSMGFLYAHLFHVELARYFPFLVTGMLSWTLISTMVIEYTDGLVAADGLIKQIKLPYSLYIHRIAMRNVLIFFHNLLVLVPVFIIFHDSVKINSNLLFIFPGLLIIYVNAISYGLILGMIGARYRDISQVIKSLTQVIFFLTPVMWSADILGSKRLFIVDFNPFYAFIELLRAPLLGSAPTLKNWTMVAAVTGLGFLINYKLFTRYRARIVYWL
ncbi:MAG TPA: ABC transporter permease [Gammaproteobacteria bacterium]|nr:ABC transporter permease [Gammaproteobacteria bacterium]